MRHLIAAIALVLIGCQGSPSISDDPMPFRVAVTPIGNAEVFEGGTPGELAFTPPKGWIERLNAEVLAQLDGKAFITAHPLPPGSGQAPRTPRHLEWLERADSVTDADLLLTLRLRHGDSFSSEQNSHILAAAPFCWIPGPHMWPVSDRKYFTDCTLTVEVYDISKFNATDGHGPPDRRRWYFSHAVTLDDLYVSFLDRAGWNLHYYATSLIVPTLLLPFEKDGLPDLLQERTIENLAASLAQDLQSRRFDLIRNELDYSFFLEEEHTRVTSIDATQARVTLRLAHRRGTSRNEPESLLVVANDLEREGQPRQLTWEEREDAHRPGSSTEDYVRYEFTELVTITEATEFLKLRVRAGKAPTSTRAYSIALPPALLGSR
jgi:hypothetical protein